MARRDEWAEPGQPAGTGPAQPAQLPHASSTAARTQRKHDRPTGSRQRQGSSRPGPAAARRERQRVGAARSPLALGQAALGCHPSILADPPVAVHLSMPAATWPPPGRSLAAAGHSLADKGPIPSSTVTAAPPATRRRPVGSSCWCPARAPSCRRCWTPRRPGYGAAGRGRGRRPRGHRGSGRAHRAGVPAFVHKVADHPTRQAWDAALAEAVPSYQPDLVVSAGFLKLVGPVFLARFGGRYVNTHNALLPSFPGMHGPRDALEYGVKVAGATLFVVDEGVDTGADRRPVRRPRATTTTPRRRSPSGSSRPSAPSSSRPSAAWSVTASLSPTERSPSRERHHRDRPPPRPPPPRPPCESGRPRAAGPRRRAPADPPGARVGLRQDRPGGARPRAARRRRRDRVDRLDGEDHCGRRAFRSPPVEDLTGFPECLDGRVKTLHPRVHAGILADTRNPDHVRQLADLGSSRSTWSCPTSTRSARPSPRGPRRTSASSRSTSAARRWSAPPPRTTPASPS